MLGKLLCMDLLNELARTDIEPALLAQVQALFARQQAKIVDAAIADTALGKAVADHKSIFFAEKSPRGELIDYHAAVSGGLQLVLDDGALTTLASDYQHMIDDGLFLDDAEPFEALLQRCRVIQKKANVLAIASRLDVS
ncbi:MAG: hypothetical protein A3J24_08005 [Deltaproteobacteria bacterium RIFCSPLOWO2_02_FULL_53_8]|nr:MAG: hypothetical protein A3J24_08005 [Deltaproteobacteria bacterium RIFCSPLOWO2_02_FULL_53_8]